MNAIVGMFARNWGLKLLALALAIIVYFSLRANLRIVDGALNGGKGAPTVQKGNTTPHVPGSGNQTR